MNPLTNDKIYEDDIRINIIVRAKCKLSYKYEDDLPDAIKNLVNENLIVTSDAKNSLDIIDVYVDTII